jgi:hypothetical protein
MARPVHWRPIMFGSVAMATSSATCARFRGAHTTQARKHAHPHMHIPHRPTDGRRGPHAPPRIGRRPLNETTPRLSTPLRLHSPPSTHHQPSQAATLGEGGLLIQLSSRRACAHLLLRARQLVRDIVAKARAVDGRKVRNRSTHHISHGHQRLQSGKHTPTVLVWARGRTPAWTGKSRSAASHSRYK